MRIRSILLAALLIAGSVTAAPGGEEKAAVRVETSKASSTIGINILNHRNIGKVTLDIRNEAGQCVYHEEGKAQTTELVRKLDKKTFLAGNYTLTVTAKDFSITQVLVVE
jgi:hypothetical protein